VSTFGALDSVARERHARDPDQIEGVVAAVRAYDGFAGSLEVVRLGILHGVNAGFDAATNGFDGVVHART
jgi:hypothetical protein